MYTKDFETALGVFDAVLDAIAKGRNSDCIGETITVNDETEPSYSCTCNASKCGGFGRADICADIKQVIFNDPATIVTFSDGSKVCVKTCDKDTFNKETGVLYAIVKRLYANDIDENGYQVARGLGEKLHKKILPGAFDQKKAAELKAKEKAEKANKKVADTKVDKKSDKKSDKKPAKAKKPAK